MSEPPLEVELKLEATAEAMDALLASPLLREHARSSVRNRQLVSTYYDSPDRRLGRRQIAFRVRQDGRRYIQTLKAPNEAGGAALARGEWEVALPGATPDLAAFADPSLLDLTGLILPDELEAVFEARFKRRLLMVEWPHGERPSSRIELAFDRGTIRAGGREQPIGEIELELKEGDAQSLFELAESLHGLAPLGLQPLDKALRGYLLAQELPPPWHKARAVTLAPEMVVDDALHLILRACVRHWLDNEAATRDARDAEGLHQLRVALRRLRSALTLFQPALDAKARAGWNDELRWLLGPLGPARDLDVFATEVVPPVRAARVDDPDLEALAGLVAERRGAAHAEVRVALTSARYRDLALRLACWVERRGWRHGADIDVLLTQRQPVRAFAQAVLERRHKQTLKRGRRFADLTPERRHQLRIAFKKLRYGTEFFGSLFPAKPVEGFRKVAARMQDLLGHLNDVAVARGLVQDLLAGLPAGTPQQAVALGAGQVIGWYAHQTAALEPNAVAAWGRFREAEPFWSDLG